MIEPPLTCKGDAYEGLPQKNAEDVQVTLANTSHPERVHICRLNYKSALLQEAVRREQEHDWARLG